MSKYMLSSTAVQIGGRVFRKKDKTVFDTSKPEWAGIKLEIEAACKAGYLTKIESSKDESVSTEKKEETEKVTQKKGKK